MSLLAAVFTSVLLLPVVTSLQTPAYLQHFDVLAQSIQLAQSETGSSGLSEESLRLLGSLLKVERRVLFDAVLKSLKRLSENGGINDKLVELLRDEKLLSGAEAGANYTMSKLCLNHTADLVVALTSRQTWALQMLDAVGKPSPAIRDLNVIWPGAFDYCRSLRSSNTTTPFSGQYCDVRLDLKKILGGEAAVLPYSAMLGLCIPDSCSGLDYTILLYEVLGLFKLSAPLHVTCPHPIQESSLDARAVVGIVICSLILFMMVSGTALDVLLVQYPKWRFSRKPNAQELVHRIANDSELQPLLTEPGVMLAKREPGTWIKVFLAFSVYTNASKLLSTNQPPGSLSCVHGIRFLSMTWVVLGHVMSFPVWVSANLVPYVTKAFKRWTFQPILNATISVDTFFVLSGLLVAYLSLKEMRKRQGKLSWFRFYVHRFWRLTPAYMLLLMFYVCIYPHFVHGPFWSDRDKVADLRNCEKNWWTNLFYVNNLVNTNEVCFGHSWYLANDMQFYILSPLIFVPFYFSSVLGAVSAGVFLLATAIAPGVITMQEHFGPSLFINLVGYNDTNQKDYMGDFYIKPYNRMGPYVVGMLAGYFLYRTDCKLRISAITNLSIWGIATATALAVVYGLYSATNGHPITLPVTAFYNAVSRQVWGACVSWVVIACVTGNGGFVNTLLSWKALIPLSRLTYCIYLLHIMVIALYLYSRDTVFSYSDLNVVFLFLGVLVISCMAAFVASLAFEAPMMGLEKIVFRRDKQPEIKTQDPAL